MTIQDIKATKSYEALKRNGFTDENILEYYSIPMSERQAYLNMIRNGGKRAIIVDNESKQVVTQKCNINDVLAMAKEHMSKDFHVNGKTYNMKALGWSFSTNTKKRAFGSCKYGWNVKEIQLSAWIIQNSNTPFEEWVNTMLHEIAHAIDVEIRGRTKHDYKWRHIALTIGCDGERCGRLELTESGKASSKYTIKCNSCGKESASHKRSKVIARGGRACGNCCRKKNGGVFSTDYLLVQIQNY